MRILILNDVAAPIGGAEIFTLRIRDELRARGHDARYLASSAFSNGAESTADHSCLGATSHLRTLNRTLNLDAYRRLRGALAGFQPDVVHVRMFMSQLSPLILPLLRSVPAIYHASTHELFCPTGHKVLPGGAVCRDDPGRVCRTCLSRPAWGALMLQRRLVARWQHVFDLFVASSDAMRASLVEHGFGPVVRVYNGVPARAPRPPLRQPQCVAYAGRLSREKGVDLLVRAFAQVAPAHPEARLLILGDGPERAGLVRTVDSLGLADRVTMTGMLERRRMEEVLDEAWVQVVPSLVAEPFGNVVAEAMMRGTAVLATGHGGPAEVVVDGETGLLVRPGDVEMMADRLGGLLGDRARAERMGALGRERAESALSLEHCVDELLEAYATVARTSVAC